MERVKKMKKHKLSPMQKAIMEFSSLSVSMFVCGWLSVIIMQNYFVWFWEMPAIVTSVVTFLSFQLSVFWVFFSHVCGHYNNQEQS